MINSYQLREFIIKPSLLAVGLYTIEDEELLISISAQESADGFYLHQTVGGKNAALGIFQMQPDTHDDIWETTLSKRSDLAYKILQVCNYTLKPKAEVMVYNLWYATIMARVFWLHVNEPTPGLNEPEVRWALYKKYWNTPKGKATHEEFETNYLKYVKGA